MSAPEGLPPTHTCEDLNKLVADFDARKRSMIVNGRRFSSANRHPTLRRNYGCDNLKILVDSEGRESLTFFEGDDVRIRRYHPLLGTVRPIRLDEIELKQLKLLRPPTRRRSNESVRIADVDVDLLRTVAKEQERDG